VFGPTSNAGAGDSSIGCVVVPILWMSRNAASMSRTAGPCRAHADSACLLSMMRCSHW
jgi:hypothetical protein